MIALAPAQLRALRARAHALHPVVAVSQKGLSQSVLNEIDRSLAAHELIKVRIYDCEREQREALLLTIGNALNCAPVQHIGNILVLWRENPRPATEKPDVMTKPRGPRLTKREAANPPRRRAAR